MKEIVQIAYTDSQPTFHTWVSECPHCGHSNAAGIASSGSVPDTIYGIGAWKCDGCARWYEIKFDLDYAKMIRARAENTK